MLCNYTFILFLIIMLTLVGAQNQNESLNIANVTGPQVGVKITSPSKNATVPASL